MQPALYGSDRYAEHFGDPFIVHIFNVSQQDDKSMLIVQLIHRVGYTLMGLCRYGSGLGSLSPPASDIGSQPRRLRIAVLIGGVKRLELDSSKASAMGYCQICRDSKQPRIESTL